MHVVCIPILLVPLTYLAVPMGLQYFLHQVSKNRLKPRHYLPPGQIMSPAKKADTAAVSFCLNRLFFHNSAHEKSSLSSLKIKGFCMSKSSYCSYKTHLHPHPWEIRISFCPSSAISVRAVLTPNSQNQTLQSEPRALLLWGLELDRMNC